MAARTAARTMAVAVAAASPSDAAALLSPEPSSLGSCGFDIVHLAPQDADVP